MEFRAVQTHIDRFVHIPSNHPINGGPATTWRIMELGCQLLANDYMQMRPTQVRFSMFALKEVAKARLRSMMADQNFDLTKIDPIQQVLYVICRNIVEY